MYLAELPWRRGCSVIRCAPRGLFSFLSVFLITLYLASLPLASSYSRVAVSSVFWAHNFFFSAQTRGAPLSLQMVFSPLFVETLLIYILRFKNTPANTITLAHPVRSGIIANSAKDRLNTTSLKGWKVTQ